MEWIKTVDQIPQDEEQVLVWYHGCELLVWNDTYKCWDDKDGDDLINEINEAGRQLPGEDAQLSKYYN